MTSEFVGEAQTPVWNYSPSRIEWVRHSEYPAVGWFRPINREVPRYK